MIFNDYELGAFGASCQPPMVPTPGGGCAYPGAASPAAAPGTSQSPPGAGPISPVKASTPAAPAAGATSYNCQPGFTFVGTGCVPSTNVAKPKTQSCQEGYEFVGTGCVPKKNVLPPPAKTTSCPPGFTFVGTGCVPSANAAPAATTPPPPSCPPGQKAFALVQPAGGGTTWTCQPVTCPEGTVRNPASFQCETIKPQTSPMAALAAACKADGGVWAGDHCECPGGAPQTVTGGCQKPPLDCVGGSHYDWSQKKCVGGLASQPARASAVSPSALAAACQASGGTWNGSACTCPQGAQVDSVGACPSPTCPSGTVLDSTTGNCIVPEQKSTTVSSILAAACKASGGTWNGSACACPGAAMPSSSGVCPTSAWPTARNSGSGGTTTSAGAGASAGSAAAGTTGISLAAVAAGAGGGFLVGGPIGAVGGAIVAAFFGRKTLAVPSATSSSKAAATDALLSIMQGDPGSGLINGW